MRFSVIDIGTNTFKLIVAEINANDFDIIFEIKRGVQLGKDSYRDNIISDTAFKRAVVCLNEFITLSQKFNSGVPKIYATAAVRDARNGKEFVQKILREIGLKIKTITGAREAELISKGVLSALEEIPERLLIMDIGGGSTEFIDVQKGIPVWKKSFPLGAFSLLQKLKPSDPVTSEDIARFNNFLESELKDVFQRFSDVHFILVGSSGSFESFFDTINFELLENQERDRRKCEVLHFNKLDLLFELLLTSNRKERLKLKGLPEYRVDTIVIASLVLNFLISTLKPVKVITSFRALKEGVIFEQTQKDL